MQKPVFVPIPYDVRRKLFNDFTEEIRPLIHKISINNTDKALDPIKKLIKSNEQEVAA